ncbi:peroxiredoxin [Roseateles sp. BYS180W]|uniref:Glutathione-dependent peroxiredoxin n=1 Tax=Roseateles rivi TaxID=3299028 RepID=A0ABW7FWG9_9BURK
MLKQGDQLPGGVLVEYVEQATEGCSIGPQPVDVHAALAGKTVAILALPGAFTPTCSAQHLPAYIEQQAAFKAAGVDEIWCISVNDPFVMAAWGREQGAAGKVRMLADGSAAYTQALGMVFDLTAKGFGVRSQRYSMLVVNGVVQALNLDAPGKFEVSDAATLLKQAQGLTH